MKVNTANRAIRDMSSLFRDYFKFVGDEDRPNPFRGLRFKSKAYDPKPPFSSEWVRAKILRPRVLTGLNPQLQAAVLMLIETGARPSEILKLEPDDIRLDASVPHIKIRPRKGRQLKTESAERDVPLVGVSLEAAKRVPEGLPHYRDKGNLFSSACGNAFRNRGLFETESHSIYSFRHSFEKRMQEANLDYGLRCLLMGHKTDRPKYGDGGSMEYRRDELLKIAHPVPDRFFESFDEELAKEPSSSPRRGRPPSSRGAS